MRKLETGEYDNADDAAQNVGQPLTTEILCSALSDRELGSALYYRGIMVSLCTVQVLSQ
jgi:hypothetical protein